MLAFLLGAASAQAPLCAALTGLTFVAAWDRRDWDLGTPSRGPRPLPTWSHRCEVGRLALGVDLVPGLEHSYSSLAGRGPLWFTTSIGVSLWRRGGFDLRSWTFTNRSVTGVGIGLTQLWSPHRVVVRTGVAPGPTPTFLGSWLFAVAPRKRDRERPWLGYEIGTMGALRAELRLQGPRARFLLDPGVRIGFLHRPRRGLLFQPLGLLALNVYLRVDIDDPDAHLALLQLSGGITVEEGQVHPVAGAAVPVGVKRLRLLFGVLVVGRRERTQAVLDGGLVVMF